MAWWCKKPWHGPLARYVNFGLRMRREWQERFLHHRLQTKPLVRRSRHASRHVRHTRAVIHVEIANPRWRGKRSRHSRRMRNPQFYVSDKMPIRRHGSDLIIRNSPYFSITKVEPSFAEVKSEEFCSVDYKFVRVSILTKYEMSDLNAIYIYIFALDAP